MVALQDAIHLGEDRLSLRPLLRYQLVYNACGDQPTIGLVRLNIPVSGG